MFWYRITDFLKTRTGHLFLFGLAVIALFLMGSKYFKKREESQELMVSQFPRLSDDGEWIEEAEQSGSPSASPAKKYQHRTANEDFTPFRPPAAAPEPRPIPIPIPEPGILEKPDVQEVFVPLTPLIKYQGKTSSRPEIAPVDRQPDPVPEPPRDPEPAVLDLEAGSLLYAELLAPLSSDFNAGVVTARLTRALIRGGKVLAPKGAMIIGSIQQASQDRLFLAPDWQLQNAAGQQVSLRGQAQEASVDPKTGRYTLDDGRAGLPGLIRAKGKGINPLWAKTLKTLAVVAGRLAQDRVRTAVGDYVPGTARNAVLEGTSRIIEQDGVPFLGNRPSQSPPVIVEAGRRFYLSVLP